VMENVLQDVHDKRHRRVVIIVEQNAKHWRFFCPCVLLDK
jgi:hypothetical protein